ncbi:hypothetical protein BX592_13738 [Paraburkholderia rhizosphaerae]|uniref:Uncharacterized protein n=1 Tax=Paraburkholderia rhizosphaerae TaxID=480658 RepID=A0A4R8L4M9_9BURK|nr:hypothetical protein BX592_13738 [Paraburkholderia rhizosphaerae]
MRASGCNAPDFAYRLLIEGARSCDQITKVQRQRLEAIDRQIADLQRRRMRLIKTLSEGAFPPVD